MAARMLILSQGLVEDEHGLGPHPALDPWRRSLERYHRRWFHVRPRNPLAWYAAVLRCPPAALVAGGAPLDRDWRQFWVATPFHAMLGRDYLQVLPEDQMPWQERDARWLTGLLNPLLEPEGMRLMHKGAAMVLACRDPLDASPPPFAAISGGLLPNRHPDGRDGGRLMRLVAEVQMLLHRFPAEHRRQAGEPDVHGVWFWGACHDVGEIPAMLPVATRNPALWSLIEARNAEWMLAEPAYLHDLLPRDGRLPRQVILAGRTRAVWLRYRRLAMPRATWQPGPLRDETHLFAELGVLLQ